MSLLLAARVWHYWLIVTFAAISVTAVVLWAILYMWRVAGARYPKQPAPKS